MSIFSIYRALGKAFGINVLFDPNLRDQEIAIDLKEVTAQASLETLMRAAGHFYKVIDEHSIIIAQDTPQNRRTYEDLVIQTFFLSNSEVKDMLTILRSLIDARKIATNEQLNAIILRDTADKVKVAERIIEANDKSKAEVVVDVELLQINTGRLRDLGVSLSSYAVTQSLDFGQTSGGTGTPTTPSGVRLSDLEFINQSNWLLNIPNFIYTFIKSNTDAQLLAKPQLRITEGEKASLVIGDRRADPAYHVQHPERGPVGRHHPHHLLPVPGRRHPYRHRAARPPQPGGDAQDQGRSVERQRLRVLLLGRPADHRHPHHRLGDPPPGR